MASWKRRGLIGEHPVLQFVNTLDDDAKSRKVETLKSWDDVILWGRLTGMVSPDEEASLEALASPYELGRLLKLRERLWTALRPGVDAGVGEAEAARNALRHDVQAALAHGHIAPHGPPPRWRFSVEDAGARVLHHRIAYAFVDLLADPALERLRECGRCSALFLDQGRGIGRRWCRMSTCGNRDKIERYRSRQPRVPRHAVRD